MFKYAIPRPIQFLMPGYTWKVDTADKVLFLTFDDGPHPEVTKWVLNQLDTYNAKATFFCVGENVTKYPEVYADVIRKGHATGNHTFHHLRGSITNNQTYFEDIAHAATHVESKLFRPPYGRIKPSQANVLRKNYELIMWDLLSRDYDPKLNVKESIMAMKVAQNGSILVFHDSVKAFENLKQLLPPLLAYFHEQGFTFRHLANRTHGSH